jgi:hypothetical protein
MRRGISHPRESLSGGLTQRSRVSPITFPVDFRIALTHDFDLTRTSLLCGDTQGLIEISVDGAEWESIATHLVSGSAAFSGDSGGWQTDTLDLGKALGGHSVQLRYAD